MGNRNILAIGTSAGGVEALRFLVSKLDADLPAAVLVTIHLPSHGESVLDELLNSAGRLPTKFAEDGEPIRNGAMYVAPADRHLLIDDDRVRLGHGPRESNARPAIDPMLRSAALCCAARTVGVVLTGTLDDGASGLCSIAECGGVTVVQDPKDAAFSDMPLKALERVSADHVVPLAHMPQLLDRLVRQPAGDTRPISKLLPYEVEVARTGRASMQQTDEFGRRSLLTCPACHAPLTEIDEGNPSRYRCCSCSAYTADLMSLALDESLRRALAVALRALEERAAVAGKLEKDARQRHQMLVAADWERRVKEYQKETGIVRDAIVRIDDIETIRRATHTRLQNPAPNCD